ncbi:Uncharacterised protein [Bordetella pertussis]|nr:Uncharacterised protein [Bordetella pertussis]
MALTPPRSIVTVPCWTSRPMRPPLTLMPLGLAMMRSAPLP